ncbi:MAG: hypothetical protein WBF32_12755 [Candidatus Aminicenantaceae bacterium]
MSDIKEDLAFPNCSSRGVDGIDPEDCVSTVNSRGRIRIILREIRREKSDRSENISSDSSLKSNHYYD